MTRRIGVWWSRKKKQFWTGDGHESTNGLLGDLLTLYYMRFTTKFERRNVERVARSKFEICVSPQFWTSDDRSQFKICFAPQFWTPDDREITKRLLGRASKFAFRHSFGSPTNTKRRGGCLPPTPDKKNQEEKTFRRAAFFGSHPPQPYSTAFFQQPSPAAFLSGLLQQPFSAALPSSLSQQPSSAAFLRSHPQQRKSASIPSSQDQQPLSATVLSSHP